MDKGAAKRFIRNALFDVEHTTEEDLVPTSARDVNQKGGLEAHLKQTSKMIERAKLQQEDSSSEEDDDIKMYDGEVAEKHMSVEGQPTPGSTGSAPGQPSAENSGPSSTISQGEDTNVPKRKRVAMDPFQGKF